MAHHPKFTQRNWLAIVNAKEVETTKQAPTPAQPVEAPAAQSAKYCAVCIPLGKLCSSEYPITVDWQDNLEEGEQSRSGIR